MKKTAALILIALSALICHGQTTTFGVKAGLNFSEQTHFYDIGPEILAGFNAGGFIDFGYKNFSLQPGLFFNMKGEADKAKYAYLDDDLSSAPGTVQPSTSRLYYIELPVNFLYRGTPMHGNDIHFGGGPYVAYGVAEHDVIPTNGANTYTFSYRNPDVGLDAIFGITIKRLLIDAGFSYGLLNIDESAPQTSHNLVASISVGYIFKAAIKK